MQEEIVFSTSKREELVDINSKVEEIVAKAKIKEGFCNVFCLHATGAIIINENYDHKVQEDIVDAMKKLIPAGVWKHDQVDGNGDSHVKAAIVGPSETVPIKDGKMQMGTWQSLGFCEFDGPRGVRKVIVTVMEGGR
ncbi:MAG: secondary thiamine-phosphate synthase enzyme YjbQ [Candidatus Woesearchaeota archaeon]|jgi:secondary thiamine-phosphate synthase enzyme|nr:secondary thiamine-phosphate synthase enzyme YjbQ [Candidatus Woesearchaeota archaeon]MDP7180737.1 secondary thiamine-phosphate synthase enzyme YjbQ [Candidatus Woesearchaeota archaeon]